MFRTRDARGKPMVIAHLGAHKTATSLIQKYFLAKKDHYLAQDLLAISRSEISAYINWGEFVLKNPGELGKYLQSRLDEAEVTRALFSNENALGKPFTKTPGLYPDHARIAAAFAKELKPFDAHVVYSIRPQWDFLQSYYLQTINQGGCQTFSQFIQTIDLDQLSWKPLIAALRKAFGADKVSVLDFRTIKDGQDKFLGKFVSDFISPDIEVDLDYAAVHNPSLSERGLQLALGINPLLKSTESGLFRKFLQQHFSNLTEPRPNLMDAALLERLQARYAEEYEQLVAA